MTHEKKETKHPNLMQEHDSKHFLGRIKERGVDNLSILYILSHFIIEYGYKEHPNAEPRPLLKPHRRAFLVQGRGLQGVVYIIDATDTKAVKVTVITVPHEEWAPLPKRFCEHWISTTKKKRKKI